ncbi:hypothetical protein HNQ55_001899 [Thalassotalea piscium]|uniref:Uncharacterized protein n=1 Tax=Thalassotalea piscium TaxID=1230533 RepID=A0A7X0NH54_9GAMM|nr:hypothetical protein [Thalassotalea piscium]
MGIYIYLSRNSVKKAWKCANSNQHTHELCAYNKKPRKNVVFLNKLMRLYKAVLNFLRLLVLVDSHK